MSLTGRDNISILSFLEEADRHGIPIIIRHVVVPGITDGKEELETLERLLARYDNIKGLDVLSYHDMGRRKYEELGLKYPLSGVRPLGEDERLRAKEMILSALREEQER